MPETPRFRSQEEYIAAARPEAQKILRKVQQVVEAALPEAERCISYRMPAYRRGKVFFFFAAFKSHLGVYPPVRNDQPLIQELSGRRNEKGNLSFKYGDDIPYALIARVAVALCKEITGK